MSTGSPLGHLLFMTSITKKLIVDDKGNPQEVIIPWDQFVAIEELLGLDFDDEALIDLQEARRDLEEGNEDAFVSLSES